MPFRFDQYDTAGSSARDQLDFHALNPGAMGASLYNLCPRAGITFFVRAATPARSIFSYITRYDRSTGFFLAARHRVAGTSGTLITYEVYVNEVATGTSVSIAANSTTLAQTVSLAGIALDSRVEVVATAGQALLAAEMPDDVIVIVQ